jgi:hypothetical protein
MNMPRATKKASTSTEQQKNAEASLEGVEAVVTPEPLQVAITEAVAVVTLDEPENSIEEVLALQAQFESKRQSAISALLARIESDTAKLAKLGYKPADMEPEWVSGPAIPAESLPVLRKPSAPPTKKRKVGGKTATESFCKICNTSGHDGRAHRYQPKKKPFTNEEIKALEK